MTDKPMFVVYNRTALVHPTPERRLPVLTIDSFEAQGEQEASLDLFMQKQRQLEAQVNIEDLQDQGPTSLPTKYANNMPCTAEHSRNGKGHSGKNGMIGYAENNSKAHGQPAGYFAELGLLEAGLRQVALGNKD
jgi:hypothetical protein